MQKIIIVLICVILAICSAKQLRLLDIDGKKVWMTENQILSFVSNLKQPKRIIDITDLHEVQGQTPKAFSYPQPRRQHIIEPLLEKVERESENSINKIITHLQTYGDRVYNKNTGVQSALWMRDEFQKIIDSLPSERKKLFSVDVKYHSWPQPSIIVRFKGKDTQMVILGAHIDTVSQSPGADDNGSGIATVLETFRIIAESDFIPEKSVEFHVYSAEEIGLRGSGEIAAAYKKSYYNVYAMMNVDMNGYNANDQIAVDTGYGTTHELTAFLRSIIKTYCTLPYIDRDYFGGSDHMSFYRQGYPACLAYESKRNPYYHSSKDTIDKIDIKYIKQWIRMGVSFIIELS
jgi:leucyl aminopeptidase